MIIRMMYVLPMILGRTFDLSMNTIGVDIFKPEDVDSPRVQDESLYRSRFKTVESSSDVRDLLEVNGELSLNIKSGKLDIRGYGAYVKDASRTQNSVDVLVKVSFRTVSKSLSHDVRPVPGWAGGRKENLGTHYVQSVLYGGDLIACVRFRALRSEDLLHVRAMVEGSLETGSALELVGGGKLEKLDQQLKGKATMEINYFATVPVEGVPNTIEGLRDLVRDFEKHVTKVNNGEGVPVEVELAELSKFDQSFNFLKNSELDTELEFFEDYLDDLMSTKSRIRAWYHEPHPALDQALEKDLSSLENRISGVLRKFYQTIADLDLTRDSSQLDDAKDAYREGKAIVMAGKFRKELNKILKKVDTKWIPENNYYSTYTQYGADSCIENDNSTSTIHQGHLATSARNQKGSGANLLCLSTNPQLAEEALPPNVNRSKVAGVKYGLLTVQPDGIDSRKIVLKSVACAVCVVRKQTVFVFYGAGSCPETWQIQYSGYVMSTTEEVSESVCVDSRLDAVLAGYMGRNDPSLNFALHTSSDGKATFVPCAVCSK